MMVLNQLALKRKIKASFDHLHKTYLATVATQPGQRTTAEAIARAYFLYTGKSQQDPHTSVCREYIHRGGILC